MRIKRVKSVLHHQIHRDYFMKKRHAMASSYLSAAMISLLIAAIFLIAGIAAIDYEFDSFVEERPMINIVLPAQN